MVEAVDARRVTVGEFDLDSISADGRGGASRNLGLEHRQSGAIDRVTGGLVLAVALPARCAGAMLAEIRKIVVAGMRVGPGNVHTGAGGDVDFHFDGLLADV